MKRWLEGLRSRASILRGFFGFLWRQKLWWMIPVIVVLLLVGTLMLLAVSTPLGPFIYTLI